MGGEVDEGEGLDDAAPMLPFRGESAGITGGPMGDGRGVQLKGGLRRTSVPFNARFSREQGCGIPEVAAAARTRGG
jgi:hypothetical protein